ncbi:MAG: hypothetical protein KAR37_06235, partial [Alphaproteobacteria bacterium]|nr:hypothetical protein [Alphaproteobacteria bacterium]
MMKIVGQIPSILSGDTARVYRFKPLKRVHALRCHPKGKGVVFSFFAKAIQGSEKLRVTLEAPLSSQTRDFQISDRWTRFEISMKNEILLKPLDIYFTTQTAPRKHSDISIVLPQVEEGLFATSAIPPDIQLPAISNDPAAVGAARDATRLWIDDKKTGVEIDSNSATTIFVGDLNPNTDQILEDQFLTFLSFWSSKSHIEISVGVSGMHGARFVVRVRERGNDEFIESNIIGGRQLYFVCVLFNRNELNVIINGAIAITFNLDHSIVFDRTYIGCSHGKNPDNLNGHVQRYIQWSTPLLYPQILEFYRAMCPEIPHHTYDYMLRYFRYSLTTVNETATVDECIKDAGFSYFIGQLDFAIPEIYKQFAPAS